MVIASNTGQFSNQTSRHVFYEPHRGDNAYMALSSQNELAVIVKIQKNIAANIIID